AAAVKLVDEAKSLRPAGFKVVVREYEAGRDIFAADPATQKAIVLLTASHLAKSRFADYVTDRVCDELLASLLRKKLSYTSDEIVKLLFPFASEAFLHNNLPISPILSVVERHAKEQGLNDSIRKQLQRMTWQFHASATYGDERKAGVRIEALLSCPPAAKEGTKRDDVDTMKTSANKKSGETSFDLHTGEAWTDAMLVELGELPDTSRRHWHAFLNHCRSAKSSKPSQRFLKQSQTHLEAVGRAEFTNVVIAALQAIGQPGKPQRCNCAGHVQYREATEIHDTHVDLFRGLVWTTSLIDDSTLIGEVGDAAERCFQKIREVGPRSPKIGNACLIALSSLASETAVAQLGRLKSRARHVSTRKQIAKAFQQAASNAGLTEVDLVELGVPHFGLTEVGCLSEDFGDVTAEATFNGNAKTQLIWRKRDGKTQKSVPVAVKDSRSSQLKELKKRLKDIDTLMPSIRQRIEHLFASHRGWNLSDFRNRFLDHPVVGVIARRLIWNVEQDGQLQSLIWHDGSWKSQFGETVQIDNAARVSIWHPLNGSADEILRWRQWLESQRIVQPFKQAHREVYILTDAERATVDHSRRFEAHIIRQHQFAALCQQRGWRFQLQGAWDLWNAPYLDLPEHNLRAVLDIDPMEGRNEITEAFVYTHLATGQVCFYRFDDGCLDATNLVPLEEIPSVVFSEVMRDVDLFVSVTSIGNDPEWLELGAGVEHGDYWQKFSFGELAQTAVARRETLQQILPSLKIAEQCRLEGRFLVVNGKLRTYKVHLGSGNVLMSPDDQYLCIVQKRGSGSKRTDNLYLPFEGDNTLSLILSKAFLLAEDDKIKDPTIVNQIRSDLP
ncbi:MAG: DUF4132 domain-containing protein, partial [Planctomycetales bacterium]|nr:DUF4132 domain-containing protein [Planctomycetales bacterium]